MTDPDWKPAVPLERLRADGRAVVRLGKKQLALFVVQDQIYACNNRCPHEGYPLAKGTLDERCVLTCHWHNWKFDLESGENLFGGDALRTYPTRVSGGQVQVDLSEPPVEQQRVAVQLRLVEAVDDDDYARIARELARLDRLGVDAADAVKQLLVRTIPRLEFGWTHACAGAADWLRLRDELESPVDRLSCAVESCAHLARDGLRHNDYPFPEGREEFEASKLVLALDAEDEATAAKQVRGAVQSGHVPRLLDALTEAALAHYQDLGHSLIYVNKARDLLRRFGAASDFAEPLLLSLTRALVFAQRDDQIPEFSDYAAALAAFGEGRAEPLTAASLSGQGVSRSLALVVEHSGAEPLSLYADLHEAVAKQLLTFDLSWAERSDRPVSDNVSWLDFTHALTFAAAVRTACERQPSLWPAGLLQLACFVGRNARYVNVSLDTSEYLTNSVDELHAWGLATLLDHGQPEPIVSVHLLKTWLAVCDEARAGYAGTTALTATRRFMASPIKRRHVRRTASQSLQFVDREG